MIKRIVFCMSIFFTIIFATNVLSVSAQPEENQLLVGTYESEYEKEVKRVESLVKPSIVYATLNSNVSVFKKGEKAEIVRDQENGKRYQLKKDGKTYWVSRDYVSIPPDPTTNTEQMTKDDIELYVNSKNFESETAYFIWIDIDRQLLHTFLGENGNWHLYKTMQCATGRNKTPTVRGTFKVYASGKKSFIKGDCWVKNFLRFYDAYMIHSNPVNGRGRIIDYTMGRRVSNGCVRTNMDESEWLVYYVPVKTTVFVN